MEKRKMQTKIKTTAVTGLIAAGVLCAATGRADIGGSGGDKGSGTPVLSEINLGVTESEEAHQVSYEHSEAVTGAFDQKARRILPKPQPERYGGEISFRVKVHPEKTNYITFKFWGDGGVNTALYLFHNDDRIDGGRRSLYPTMRGGRPNTDPFPGRFFYATKKIPEFRTAGKEHIELRLRGAGPGWGKYGRDPEHQTKPSRPVYRIYTHTNPFFEPSPEEPQGEPVEGKTPRLVPEEYADADLREKLIEGVDARIKEELEKPAEDADVRALSQIYDKEWSKFYQSREVLDHAAEGVIESVDTMVKKNQVEKGRWGAVGRGAGAKVCWVYEHLEETGALEETIDVDGDSIPRRRAYAQFFEKALQLAWKERGNAYTSNMAYYTGRGICWMHAALKRLDPEMITIPEEEIYGHVIEILGLDDRKIAEVTDKGLLRERWGYDAGYGWPQLHHNSGWPPFVLEDKIFQRRMQNMVWAINHLIVPAVDNDGNRILRRERVISFRKATYPGNQPPLAKEFAYAAILGEPSAIRIAQLYLYRNQISEGGLPTSPDRVDYILRVMDMPAVNTPLPMEDEHPDFVFADEGMGVVAMKHGERRIFASFWLLEGARRPARRASIHYTTPTIDRIAFVKNTNRYETRQGKEVEISGEPSKDPGRGRIKEVPKAAVPPSIHKGFAAFNKVRYGDYLFGMNSTYTKTYELEAPVASAKDLVSGKMHRAEEGNVTIKVPPRTTAVLYLGKE